MTSVTPPDRPRSHLTIGASVGSPRGRCSAVATPHLGLLNRPDAHIRSYRSCVRACRRDSSYPVGMVRTGTPSTPVADRLGSSSACRGAITWRRRSTVATPVGPQRGDPSCEAADFGDPPHEGPVLRGERTATTSKPKVTSPRSEVVLGIMAPPAPRAPTGPDSRERAK
jgi:hypothetical protein